MVLYDNEYMCVLCDERYDSQQDYMYHLSGAHTGQRIGYNSMAMRQSTAVPRYHGNKVHRLASPFAPVPRQPYLNPQQQYQQLPHPHYPHAYAPRQAIPRPAAPPQTLTTRPQILTPTSSKGSGSPAPPSISVPTQNQTYSSPHSTPQPAQCSPSQQYRNQVVYRNTLQRRAQARPTPYQLRQQSAQRRMSAGTVGSKKAASKPSTPVPTNTTKLDPYLPPLPQVIYDLGLTDADFDPSINHGGNCISSRYIDIPAETNIADGHMFNANSSTILGFGNLLRLAGRYTITELVAKFNAKRPGLFKNTLINKRLQAAAKWAYGRLEWQDVGNVHAWLEKKQKMRQHMLEFQSCKKRRDYDSLDHSIRSLRGAAGHAAVAVQDISTPPAAKRARDATWAVPQPLRTPLERDQGTSSTIDAGTQAASSYPPSYGAWTTECNSTLLPVPDTPLAQNNKACITSSIAAVPNPAAASEQRPGDIALPVQYTASDFADLSNFVGMQDTIALVSELCMTKEQNVDGVKRKTVTTQLREALVDQNTSLSASKDIEEEGVYDALLAELIAHPENFMSAHDLRMGKAFAHFTAVMRMRKGLR